MYAEFKHQGGEFDVAKGTDLGDDDVFMDPVRDRPNNYRTLHNIHDLNPQELDTGEFDDETYRIGARVPNYDTGEIVDDMGYLTSDEMSDDDDDVDMEEAITREYHQGLLNRQQNNQRMQQRIAEHKKRKDAFIARIGK